MADDYEGDGGDVVQVEEEYAIWKKNTPVLYDLVISHALEWPSLTVHWLPFPPKPYTHPSLAAHRLVLGTHTSDDFPNYLLLADALLPSKETEMGALGDDPNSIIPKVEITQKIRVDGEVNKARSMPQNPSIVGAKTSATEVYVFDCTRQEGKPEGGDCDPDVRLRGHDKEGYGLSWNSLKEGYLLSGSHDCKICLWDVSALPQEKVLDAMHVYEGHESVVGDVSWHLKNDNLFGSVGDDCKLVIWDLRTNQSQHSVKVHEKEIVRISDMVVGNQRVYKSGITTYGIISASETGNSLGKLSVNYLSFHPYNEWILATASSDTTVGLFDMRKLTVPLHVLSSHTEEVFQVEWDPNHETVLASSADDRRLNIWDLNRIGDEQQEGDGDDGPPELLFSHGGHKAKISEFSWNKYEPWVISSVAQDNTLQVWQVAESIYADD